VRVRSLLENLRTDEYVEPARLTLADYLRDEWLPPVRHRLRFSTYDAYRRNIERHVIPRLGRIRLQKLRPADLTRFYSELVTSGRGERGGLSPKTVRNIHQMPRKALEDAMQHNYVPRNVAARASVPRSGGLRRQMAYWTAAELRRFLDQQVDHPFFAAWYLAASTGMRRGEVLGLLWRDIDLDRRRLSVRRSLISVGYELQESDTKTTRSERVLDLDDRTVAVLREHQQHQATTATTLGIATPDAVFRRVDGTPIHPDLFTQAFGRSVRRAEVPRIRLHDLRHTHATLLLQAGVSPKIVSERLGHATVAFTMQVYAHVIPGMQADAAAPFGERVFAPEMER
jgi:integrase